MTRLIESSSAQLRLDEARAFVRDARAHAATSGWSAPSRGAVDDLARAIAASIGRDDRPASFQPDPARRAPRGAGPRGPGTGARHLPRIRSGRRARHVRSAARRARSTTSRRSRSTPGFPRALARTLQELRLAQVGAGSPGRAAARRPRSRRSCSSVSTSSSPNARATDRATLFDAATQALRSGGWQAASAGASVRRHCCCSTCRSTRRSSSTSFARCSHSALSTRHSSTLIDRPLRRRRDAGSPEGARPRARGRSSRTETSDLVALRRYLFARSQPPEREPAGDVRLLLGAGRRARVRRDRAPDPAGSARAACRSTRWRCSCARRERYVGLLEHALRPRRRCPRWFDRGTRRPHPAGRAFLAILACAVRAAVGAPLRRVPRRSRQVPRLDEARARARSSSSPLDDEDSGCRTLGRGRTSTRPGPWTAILGPPTSDLRASDLRRRSAIVEGTLRAPWKWETLIVESAVIGGDPARWHRRLTGLANELRLQRDAERRDDPDSPRRARIERDLRNLGHLRAFALPIIDLLASWPESATWGEWLDRFAALAPMVLRQPERVLRVLEQLRPMAEIGPVSLDEARDVIADRLQMLEIDPPRSALRPRVRRRAAAGARPHVPRRLRRRARRADVSAAAARGSDAARSRDARAARRRAAAAGGSRAQTERLLLRLAVGAPTERLWLSYPRLDTGGIASARAELLRARRHARDHRAHSAAAAAAGARGRRRRRGARLAGAGAARRRDRRSRARPRRPAQLLAGRAARVGPRPRALPAAAERVARSDR